MEIIKILMIVRCGLKRRVTVRHHEACRMMPNNYSEWRNFQFALNNHYTFFFFHTFPLTIVFKLGYALLFSVLRWNKYIFDQEMFVSPLISDVLTSCMRLSYTRWYKTEISITGENREKSCWVCKKRLVVCIKRFLKLVSYNRTFTVLTINQLFGMYLKHAMRKGFVGTYAHTLLFLS